MKTFLLTVECNCYLPLPFFFRIQNDGPRDTRPYQLSEGGSNDGTPHPLSLYRCSERRKRVYINEDYDEFKASSES